MPDLRLSLALGYCDHVSDLITGAVRAPGLELAIQVLPVEEIFFRMAAYSEWDAAEFSMGKYAALVAAGNTPVRAIPVFPSRLFRHSAIYVRANAGIGGPRDLAGKRVGVPEWAQTAGIYVRGLLQHQYGVRLEDIEWYQGGVNQAGRAEKVALSLPAGIRLTGVADRSLSHLLVEGELEAICSAREPAPFLAGDARIQRLFPDYRSVEEAYYRETGIFPIMHTVVIRQDILDRHPWVARNLFDAFEAARARSLARLASIATAAVPLPWSQDAAARAREIFGPDYWPYGIDANRTTLDAFLRYCCEQGIGARALDASELFPATVQASFKV